MTLRNSVWAFCLTATLLCLFSLAVQAQESHLDQQVEESLEQIDRAGEDAAEHAGGHAEEGHDTGPPMGFKTDLALWSLVTFLVFLFVLTKFAWNPLSSGLAARDERIRRDLADAETARVRAEQMLAEHQKKLDHVQEEVREIIAEARRDADRTKQDIIAEARKEADLTQKRAVDAIDRAKQQALDELMEYQTRAVRQATETVLGRAMTDQDQDRLIGDALAQFRAGAAGRRIGQG